MTTEEPTNSEPNFITDSSDLTNRDEQILAIYLPEENTPTVDQSRVVFLQTSLQDVVELAAAEVIRITKQDFNQAQDGQSSSGEIPAENMNNAVSPTGAKLVFVRKLHAIHWVHDLNLAFITLALIFGMTPFILSSGVDIELTAAKDSYPRWSISKGDLIVSKIVPASQIEVNDLLFLRHDISWEMDIRQVLFKVTNENISTITTSPLHGGTLETITKLASDKNSYKISKVIPNIGYASIILSSSLVKFFGALFILILNAIVFIRRKRRTRLEVVIPNN